MYVGVVYEEGWGVSSADHDRQIRQPMQCSVTYLKEAQGERGLGPLVLVLGEEEQGHPLPEARARVERKLGEGVEGVGQALQGEPREAGGGL